MEYEIWGTYGKSEIEGVEIFHGNGYKFKFRCTYQLSDVTVQSNYTVDSQSALPVGIVLQKM